MLSQAVEYLVTYCLAAIKLKSMLFIHHVAKFYLKEKTESGFLSEKVSCSENQGNGWKTTENN